MNKILSKILSTFICLILTIILSLLITTSANAAPLNLLLNDAPDIMSSFIEVAYDAGSDQFAASGFAMTLNDDDVGAAETITDGLFEISAMIDESGTFSSGMLAIGGTIASLGFNSGTLLTGTLTAFGFRDEGGDPLEFLFDVTGGDAAGLFGSTAGVILSNSGFAGSFSTDFDNCDHCGNGISDTGAPVPEPATFMLLLSGCGLLVIMRKYKSPRID